MLRQKRTTVGLLTCARSASSLTGRLAKARGSPSTSRATRCSAGASEGIEALMRSSMAAARWWLAFLAPAEAVARDHRAGRTWTPGASGVGPRAALVGGPVLQDGLHPAPCSFLLVAAHEQVQPA